MTWYVSLYLLVSRSPSFKALPVQARLFKSLKLWSFYVDLEESIGTVETTKKVYDKILELKIANAQVRPIFLCCGKY
jgi:pre-mRNA-splicing factor SYF1